MAALQWQLAPPRGWCQVLSPWCRVLALGAGLRKLLPIPCYPSSVGLWQLLPLLDECMIPYNPQPAGPSDERSTAD